jgi:hypothetical protein
MLESLRRFSALERPAQTMFLRALLILPLVSLSLKWRGFEKTCATLQGKLPSSQLNLDFVEQRARLTARAVNSADRHGLVHSSCLGKSLTLWWMLGRQGISSRLRIGIRKGNNKLEAHAWVERDGVAVNEPEEHHLHYAPFEAAFTSLTDGE